MFKKVAKRIYKKGKKFLKKRYVRKGAPNMKNIIKDVKMLKHLVNVEKKRSDTTVTIAQPFARSNASADGAYHAILSPTISQGLQGNERVGNSIKLVSGCLDVSIEQQVNALNSNKIKLMIVCRQENAANYTSTATLNSLLEVNPFTSRRDFYSNRDPEFFSEFRVIKSITMLLAQDNISSGIARIQKKIPLKFNHHLKYNNDGTTTTTKNQFYLIALASDGEMASPTLTGAQIQYNMRWYFTDN